MQGIQLHKWNLREDNVKVCFTANINYFKIIIHHLSYVCSIVVTNIPSNIYILNMSLHTAGEHLDKCPIEQNWIINAGVFIITGSSIVSISVSIKISYTGMISISLCLNHAPC
jgi:hypothetical protein